MRKPNLRRKQTPEPVAPAAISGCLDDAVEYPVSAPDRPDAWAPAPSADPYEPPPRQVARPRHAVPAEARSGPAPYLEIINEPALAPTAASASAGPSGGGRWDPIVVDRPILDLEPKPSPTGQYRPDTEFDGWSTPYAALRMASVRGYRHRYYGRPRQDHAETAVHTGTGTIVFAVADGVSSAEQGEIGAIIACHAAIDAVLDHLSDADQAPAWECVLARAAGRLAEKAALVLNEREPDLSRVEKLFATTLVIGAARPANGGLDVSLARVGDSGAWILHPGRPGNRYDSAFALKAGSDAVVVSNAVSPLPRIPEQVEQLGFRLSSGAVLLIGTDGFGDPLGDGDGQVGELFADHLSAPPPARELAHVLDFSRETFDDDRTLLVLWPRESGGLA